MDVQNIYKSIVDNMTNGAYFVDRERKILFWNHAAEEITGYGADEIVGRSCPESMLHHVDERGTPLCQEGCPLFATNIDGKQRRERVFVRHKNGYRMPVRINVFPIYEDGEIQGSVEIFDADSPARYDEALLESVSGVTMRDTKSGLPNRHYIESYLGHRMSEYRHFGRMFALVMAEIDDLAALGKQYGKQTAGHVIANIGTSIKNNLRRADLVGHWEAERFLGIYTISKNYDIPVFAETMRQAIVSTDIPHETGNLRVTASVGVTVPKPSDYVPSLIRRAQKLMDESREAGKNRITIDPRLPL